MTASVCAGLALLALALPAVAAIDLVPGGDAPRLFDNDMVLQRDTYVPVWGSASAGESVSVTIAGQTKSTVTGTDGHWRVVLDPIAAGGPYTMTLVGTNTIVLSGVLVGDVWVCSGQSNMLIRRVRASVRAAYPDIRTIGRSGRWGDPPSGAAFAFARAVNAALGVPIGIINRAVAGKPIQSWMAPAAVTDPDPETRAIVNSWLDFGEQYARQIAPFVGFAIRGVVWWQGEQDLKLSIKGPGSVEQYYYLLPGMIRSWRAEWGIGDIPFVFMQLPTGGGLQLGEQVTPLPPAPIDPPQIAEIMRNSTFNGLSAPATGLTVSIDIDGGVHPKDRELYGQRIADVALATAYGQSFVYSGPIYSSMSVENGNRVRLRFKANTAAGLQAIGGPLQGFSISADGLTFVWAQAQIENDDEVVVWNDAVANPTVVRYGWDRHPTWANLFNGAGLGAAPFSTVVVPAP